MELAFAKCATTLNLPQRCLTVHHLLSIKAHCPPLLLSTLLLPHSSPHSPHLIEVAIPCHRPFHQSHYVHILSMGTYRYDSTPTSSNRSPARLYTHIATARIGRCMALPLYLPLTMYINHS